MTSITTRGADIAVVGAAGKTGRAVVAALAAATPVPVRRLSRSSEHPIDLETGAGLDAALTGCRAVYFIAPNVHPDEPALLRRVLEAAADAGVEHVVYHSVAWPYSPAMPHHLDKARCEDLLREFAAARGLRWTVLQPCAYAENFEAALTGEAGSVTVPYSPDTRFRFVSLEDVAQIAARVLIEGIYVHHGATYELGGPAALSVRQLVRLVEDTTGRAVPIVRIDPAQWATAQSPTMPDDAVRRLVAMFEYYNQRDFLAGSAVTAALLGRPPTPVSALIRD
ncbi:NmrA family NAD(P)-binding protein [Tomitella biformata]|uniref:NmrA family NAD(P)-binding protein n=1 Tax=Tomitella biformata TaxID=630403 RepID=UPI0004640102|nr:NmrA family NAD(P)-binding protein [Tomitella biformata]